MHLVSKKECIYLKKITLAQKMQKYVEIEEKTRFEFFQWKNSHNIFIKNFIASYKNLNFIYQNT